VIAHVGGVPLEETLPSVTGAGFALLLARAWVMPRLRRDEIPENDREHDAAHGTDLALVQAARCDQTGAERHVTAPGQER
jgi:hypothetical protein